MLTVRRLLPAALMALAGSIPAMAGLIVNGSFETPVVVSFVEYGAAPGVAPPVGFAWSVPVNNVDVVNPPVGGYTAPAFDGVQYLDLVGVGSTGGIAQSFATTAGTTYALAFYYGNNALSTSTASARVEVTGTSSLLSTTVTHSSSTLANNNWTLFSGTFTADSASTTLAFTTTVGGGNGGVILDLVDVTEAPSVTPEPGTLLLIGGGLAAAGWWKRRG